MSDYHQFGEPSGAGFIDTHFDFARCQRADGSFYGTGGVCRKGTQTGAKEKEAPKGKSKASPKRDDSKDLKNKKGEVIGTSPRNMLVDNIKTMEGRLKDSRSEGETKLLKDSIAKAKAKLASEDKAAKPAPKADSKATQANVRKLDKAAKEADKKAAAADKAWRKAGMPKGDQQKEVRRLDKEAKALNKAATKMDKEWRKSQGIK